MRRLLLICIPFLASLGMAAGARAVMIDMNALGSGTSVTFNSNDQTGYYGVALVPGARQTEPAPGSTTAGYLTAAGVPWVTSSAPCADPAAGVEPDVLQAGSWPLNPSPALQPLCWHGGPVMHANETFALEWESTSPNGYWPGTKAYVQQFLSNVASGSSSLSSPFADTTQYWDGSSVQDRAANLSVFGGGCDDSGTTSCLFAGSSTATPGPGNPLPSTSDCPVSGVNHFGAGPAGTFVDQPNNLCLSDAAVRSEVLSLSPSLVAHTQPGYTPLVDVLTPPGVEVCLNSAGTLCSANSDATPSDTPHTDGQFCSYHSEVYDPSSKQDIAYVVQPWTALTTCDEPEAPPIHLSDPPLAIPQEVGANLVSPLSQSQIAAIVNPDLNAWFGLDGLEINDENACQPVGTQGTTLDQVSVGTGSYILQREFNNAAVVSNDPSTYNGCTPIVILSPSFVAPSAVNQGDVIDFDGSATASTLIVPNANYAWDFGDGTSATGPSVQHSYTKGGSYTVKLTVTDRGGNSTFLSELVQVLGPNGLPVPPPSPVPTTTPSGGGSGSSAGLKVKLQLLPQGFRAVLRRGIALRVSSNEAADGFATISISRRLAKRAHIKTGRKPFVIIGTGTVAGVKDGTVVLRLRMSRAMAKKLAKLHHPTLTVRLALVDSAGKHMAVDVAGRY